MSLVQLVPSLAIPISLIPITTLLKISAAVCCGVAAYLACKYAIKRIELRRHTESLRKASGLSNEQDSSSISATGYAKLIIKMIDTQVNSTSLLPQNPSPATSKDGQQSLLKPLLFLKARLSAMLQMPLSRWLDKHAKKAGRSNVNLAQACLSTGFKLGSFIGIAFGLIGMLLSAQLGWVCLASGFFLGLFLPCLALLNEERARCSSMEKELSDFFEITALGLRSSLSFDQSFSLYAEYFDTPFARSCKSAQESYQLGVKTRSDALYDLTQSYSSALFTQVIKDTSHALRCGTSLTPIYINAAQLARADYQTQREIANAKAPIKMMIPIGVLILPAMLIMVLGPVLLNIMDQL